MHGEGIRRKKPIQTTKTSTSTQSLDMMIRGSSKLLIFQGFRPTARRLIGATESVAHSDFPHVLPFRLCSDTPSKAPRTHPMSPLNGQKSTDPRATAQTTLRWGLFRLDAYGIESEMSMHSNEAAAREECAEYERRGHKQTYVVRRVSP